MALGFFGLINFYSLSHVGSQDLRWLSRWVDVYKYWVLITHDPNLSKTQMKPICCMCVCVRARCTCAFMCACSKRMGGSFGGSALASVFKDQESQGLYSLHWTLSGLQNWNLVFERLEWLLLGGRHTCVGSQIQDAQQDSQVLTPPDPPHQPPSLHPTSLAWGFCHR